MVVVKAIKDNNNSVLYMYIGGGAVDNCSRRKLQVCNNHSGVHKANGQVGQSLRQHEDHWQTPKVVGNQGARASVFSLHVTGMLRGLLGVEHICKQADSMISN